MMNRHHHVELLSRFERGLALREAIRARIRPGCRVLDAGTGTGILAIWAAQAGAEVVAVDFADVSLARELARANKVDDRITFLQARLDDVTPDDVGGRFDAMTAMVYFNDPRRDEAQSQLVFDVRDRLLTSDAVLIPDHVVYRAGIFDWPNEDLPAKHDALRVQQRELVERYGLDFGPLIAASAAVPPAEWYPSRDRDGTLHRGAARPLSDDLVAFTVDYCADAPSYPASLDIALRSPGIATSVIWTQELYARDALIFRNESLSWLAPPVSVTPSDTVSVALDDEWRRSNQFSAAIHQAT
jgi:SAM-dependent methyltransferase